MCRLRGVELERMERTRRGAMKNQHVMGIFPYLDDFVKALKALKEGQFEIGAAYSPTKNHEILEALGIKPSSVRYFTLTGGILGILAGAGLAVYTAMQWMFVVDGKPPVPAVPYVIVAFEFCILISVFFNLFGLAFNTRLPKFKLPEHYDPRFSEDRFGVLVHCSESERESVAKILKEAGAEEVHDAKK
jgi:hypothetical protein